MNVFGASRTSRGRAVPRGLAAVGYRAALGLTAVTDLLSADLRFGHMRRALAALAMPGGLPAIPRSRLDAQFREETAQPLPEPDLRCLLVAGPLDRGGVEAVVATLARGLPGQGIATEVVCTREGRTSSELRAAGVRVTLRSAAELPQLVGERDPDVVQLHRPDRELAASLLTTRVAVVPVFHAIESYLDAGTWMTLSALVSRPSVCVAVSAAVKAYFEDRLGSAAIHVVPNGVSGPPPGSGWERAAARRVVGDAVGAEIADDDILVVALQRFSDQKNPAGLVDAFLKGLAAEPRLRLVLAGSPENWLEVRRADLLRRASPLGGRVHLLGDSDPWVILRSGDLYALDSFAEGGPLSAVEAVMCGLPVVLSDVGFAGDLVASAGVQGAVVSRANSDYSQSAMARERRRRHQSNYDEFGATLAEAARFSRSPDGFVPPIFTQGAMILEHATVLRAAARNP